VPVLDGGKGLRGFNFPFKAILIGSDGASHFVVMFFVIFDIENFDIGVIPASNFIVVFFHFNKYFYHYS
jgi:hypothetical protein